MTRENDRPKGFIAQAFDGIAAALAAGNVHLAARIAWLGLKVVWLAVSVPARAIWADWKLGLLKVACRAFYGSLAAIVHARYGLRAVRIEIIFRLRTVRVTLGKIAEIFKNH